MPMNEEPLPVKDAGSTAAPLRTHQPKGGMCRTCAKAADNCAPLPFESMPVIDLDKATGARIVRCSLHQPLKDAS